jgi:hypothetical protein
VAEHMDALGFLRAVLDRDRLALIGLVALRPHTADELAQQTSLRVRDVLEALGPLVQGGLVDREDEAYRLRPEALRALAQDLPQTAPPDRRVLFGMTADEQTVLARFFRGGRLVEIPASHAKRRVVLERIALEFEPGVRYAEAAVNELLAAWHPDYAALRRYLVDEGFLDREAGEYWRSGGRV